MTNNETTTKFSLAINIIAILFSISLAIGIFFFYNKEKVETCIKGYANVEGKCIPLLKDCSVTNGTGYEILSDGIYSTCMVESCNTGFMNIENLCLKRDVPNIEIGIETGNTIMSGGIDNNIIQDIIGEYTKELIINQSGLPKNKSLNNFPTIKINKKITDVKLIAEIEFTDFFINNYKYEDSQGYFFALKFFVGDFDNGGFYNVYRKQNGGVGNSSKHGLVGAKLAYQIKNGVTWYIDLDQSITVAVKPEKWSLNYQYKYINIEKYLEENIGKEIPIGVYLSSTSEMKGRELTKIKSLKIVYTGREGDLEIVGK